MFKLLFNTNESLALFFMRLGLGFVIFAHGAQKVFAWFGGPGFNGTVELFTKQLHLPLWMALLLMFIELFGSLGLIFGFLTRLAALGIGVSIGACASMYHLQNGFFMNWLGRQKGEGFEYHLLVICICLALLIEGGGLLSVDGGLMKRSAARYYRRYR